MMIGDRLGIFDLCCCLALEEAVEEVDSLEIISETLFRCACFSLGWPFPVLLVLLSSFSVLFPPSTVLLRPTAPLLELTETGIWDTLFFAMFKAC